VSGEAGATRTGLLALAAREAGARKGLDLLRSKRKALVRELFEVMDRALLGRERLAESMTRSGQALAAAFAKDGKAEIVSASFPARRDVAVTLEERNVWGVRFPEIRSPGLVRAADGRGYSPADASAAAGEAARAFEESLEAVFKVVDGEMRLRRIGAEVRRTTRRVNALTEVVIPRLEAGIREIRLALEEREREETYRLKRFKTRAVKARGG
jgi:V/A-type H+-transporting ATPase subunit D